MACVEPMIRRLRPRTNRANSQKDENNNQQNPQKITEPPIAVSQTEAATDPISENPALTKTRSESIKQIPTMRRNPPRNSTVNSQADANAVGGEERNPTNANAVTISHNEINKCFKCKRTFTSKSLECTLCLKRWHKQDKCSGDKDKMIAKMMSEDGWQCKNCRDAADTQPREQSNPSTEVTTEREHNEAPIPEVNNPTQGTVTTNACGHCKQTFKETAKTASCYMCKSKWHKQVECSGGKRFTLEKQIKEGKFKCKACKGQQSTPGMQMSQASSNTQDDSNQETEELPQKEKMCSMPINAQRKFP